MSKRKKTRQQKIITDLRRKLILDTRYPQSPLVFAKPKEIKNNYQDALPTSTALLQNYPYIKRDLLKTAFLTGSIVVLELLLSFLLKTHLIKLPMGNF